MGVGTRTAAQGVVVAGLIAGASAGASAAVAAPAHGKTTTVTFRAQHVPGVRGLVLTEGKGLVVYTFTGEKSHQNHADSAFKVVSVR